MEQTNKLSVPAAIIIAGALVAGAVLLGSKGSTSSLPAENQEANPIAREISIRPVSSDDHILGSPDASAIIVEYSDTECPFCKRFHSTMNEIVDEYGKDGRAAWVYRHFPIVQLHSKAPKEAEATECAADLGGNNAFWKYTNRIYEVTPTNDGLDPAELPKIAKEIGLDQKAFETCLSSGKFTAKVQADYEDAGRAGGQGTPYSVILLKRPINEKGKEDIFLAYAQIKATDSLGFSPDGMMISVSGAMPYELMKYTIDTALANN